jgi:transposase
MDTTIKQGTRKGRLNYSMDFKRRLAAAACAPNVSVSKLALAHEVNANMLFKWRRQYRAGLFGADAEPAFLPVAMTTAPQCEPASSAKAPVPVVTGVIEIEIADARVRVHGAVDATAYRVDQGTQQPAGFADPARQQRTIEFDAVTGVNYRLAIQCKRDGNAGSSARGNVCDDLRRGRGSVRMAWNGWGRKRRPQAVRRGRRRAVRNHRQRLQPPISTIWRAPRILWGASR